MLAISIVMGTKYACNRFHLGPNMLAIIKNLFWRDSSRSDSYVTLGQFSTLQAYLVIIEKDCKHKWSLSNWRLQAYLVPIIIEVASILGPHCFHDCTHIWSFL